MTDATAARTRLVGAVWTEQLRVTGLSIRREAVLAALALNGFCLAVVVMARVPAVAARVGNEFADFHLDPGEAGFGFMAVLAALLFPLVVWKGEGPWGGTPIWSLPVDHRRHMLLKVAAGWIWLVVLLAAALVCIVVAVLVGGGTLGVDEIRPLITNEAAFFTGAVDATRSVAWSTPWWEWVLPFTAATAAYLLSSALFLATPHPFRWAVAIYVMTLFPMLLVELFEIESWLRGAELFAWSLGAEDFGRGARLANGDQAHGWLILPSVRMWAVSTVLWIGLGLASVLAASGRRRDH